ncbi:MAG: RecX family transcriptional regulator [Stellaceae bacterium]
MGKETRPETVDAALIERWALAYLERFASSGANLRRVLLRRARRHAGTETDGAGEAGDATAIVDALVARYRTTGLIDDVAYAAARVRAGLRRGRSLVKIRAGLAAKGVAAPDRETAIGTLDAEAGAADPDLVAACAFARRRRLGPFRRTPEEGDGAMRMKELGTFARAGFSRAIAEAVLACATPDDAEALLCDEG